MTEYDIKDGVAIIPESVNKIGYRAFEDCKELKSVVLPDSVTIIERSAFSGCTELTHITIPNSVTKIGDSAFERCAALTDITIPDSVTEIGRYAFQGCTGLTCVTIPDSVIEIGRCAFCSCTGLTSITIGSAVRTIGNEAFIGCDQLNKIYLRVADPTQIEIERGSDLGASQATIFVPGDKKVVSAYKKKNIWKKFSGIENDATCGEVLPQTDKKCIEEQRAFLKMVGVEDNKLELAPLPVGSEPEEMMTVVYNIDEDELPFTATIETESRGVIKMLVDDKQAQSMKKKITFKKPGQHIIRLLPVGPTLNHDLTINSFPGCELIKIPDNWERFYSTNYLDDFRLFEDCAPKRLLLGEKYEGGGDGDLNYRFDCIENISVVPNNPYYEVIQDCIVTKDTKTIVFMPSRVTEIPQGCRGVVSADVFNNWSSPVLRIPGSIKSVDVYPSSFKKIRLEEIIIEEGVLKFYLGWPFAEMSKLKRVELPSSIEVLNISKVELDSLVIPTGVRMIESLSFCHIKRLEITGDVVMNRPRCFNNFEGELFLAGNIKPYEEVLAGEPGVKKSFGCVKDNCIIHVKDESVAQTIRECDDFNKNAKIITDN